MMDAEAGIRSALEKMWKASCQALDESADEILKISSQTYCPVDTGLLKSTAKDELVVDSDSEHTRELSYDTDYAKIVHEVPYNHYNPPLAQYKYLEVPTRLQEQKVVANIQSAARDSVDS